MLESKEIKMEKEGKLVNKKIKSEKKLGKIIEKCKMQQI